jgi:hypothetical protein
LWEEALAREALPRPVCPRKEEKNRPCQGKVTLRGVVERKPRLPHGDRAKVLIRQCVCAVHGWFREIPPFLLPQKHYAAGIIEEALASPLPRSPSKKGVSQETFCRAWGLPEPSTPGRWLAQFVGRVITVGREVEGRLMGLRPQWRQPLQVCGKDRWTYSYVWGTLQELREACLACRLPPPSLPRLALFEN